MEGNSTIIFFFSIFFVVGLILLIYQHEAAHMEIFTKYDIDSHIEWISYFPDVATVPENNLKNCNEYCILAHNINESVGYHLFPFYILFGMYFLLRLIQNDKEI